MKQLCDLLTARSNSYPIRRRR